MQIYSSINNSHSLSLEDQANRNASLYQQLNTEFVKCGFTYKSNQILHKISARNPKDYPYLLLLHLSKLFHLNQFQIIFYSHILNQVQPCYDDQPQIFQSQDHIFPEQTQKILNQIYEQGINKLKVQHNEQMGQSDMLQVKNNFKEDEDQYQQQNYDQEFLQYTFPQLKKITLYLMVIGYAVKYYLNEQMKIKPYEQHIKKIFPNFFSHVFNKWAKKYGNSVLNTTPRKINSFYVNLGFLEQQEQNNEQKGAQDYQNRNYNQIVQQLIKATSEGQQQHNVVGDIMKGQVYDEVNGQQGVINGNNNQHQSSQNQQRFEQ